MTTPVMKVDRVSLYESPYRALEEEWSEDGRSVKITGNEVSPSLTLVQITARRENILSLPGKFAAVVFEDKTENNGYYMVVGSDATLTNWKNEAAVGCVWKMQLIRLGSDTEIDIESRLSGAQTRQTDHAVVGTRWQAPPIGHYAFWAGTSSPSVLDRIGIDGAVRTYLALSTTVNTRYGCSVGNYIRGRVRFIDSNVQERIGVDFTTSAVGWSLENDLVKVIPAIGTGVIDIQSWDGGAFRSKLWDFRIDGVSLGVPQFVNVVRNDPYAVTVRMLWPNPTVPGRVTVDLLLRRGSRFVEVYFQRSTTATLLIRRLTTEAGTANTGWVGATANDVDGNRYIIGSARTFTADVANGGLSVAAATKLDAFIGAIIDGGTAVVGDRGIDLMQQYLGAPSETVMGVRR